MHELSIVTSMISIVRENMVRHGAGRLNKIKIRVGEMSAVEPEALRFCFEACAGGTDMEGVILDIEEVPVMGQCLNCKKEFQLTLYLDSRCPVCGGEAGGYVSGSELDIVSMEVE
ncbi:MAG: hydrogenase maturation nickel metallochaperone HypA [Planctomycetes bacterium]|nr:hydrogenase maturation nickel metallochaperone HypA [Planctomycetota bacterium]